MYDFDDSTQNIDDILMDVRSLLSEEESEPVRQRDRTLQQKLQTDREATMVFDARFADIVRGASESADKAARDYGPGQEDEPEERPAAPSFVAYNNDFGGDRFRAVEFDVEFDFDFGGERIVGRAVFGVENRGGAG